MVCKGQTIAKCGNSHPYFAEFNLYFAITNFLIQQNDSWGIYRDVESPVHFS